jgi:hypothetical protein
MSGIGVGSRFDANPRILPLASSFGSSPRGPNTMDRENRSDCATSAIPADRQETERVLWLALTDG